MSRKLVFAGPTISAEEICARAAGVEVYPPVAAGDLLRFSLAPGDLVAIIDGYYFQSAPVRHKEILDLLRRGIHVWGAASMGALRAAELHLFGMKGFGQIFKAYVDGDIDGDDEVAVLHAPEDMDYALLSEALVNIRYACCCAVTEELLLPDTAASIVAIAAHLPFHERSYQSILQRAVAERVLSQELADTFLSFARQETYNLKKRDALQLLQALQEPLHYPVEVDFSWHETTFMRHWRLQEQGTVVDERHRISDLEVLAALQLFGENYSELHYRILLQTLSEIASQTAHPAQEWENAAGEISAGERQAAIVARHLVDHYGFSLQQELPNSASRWLRPEERTLPRVEQLARLAVRQWQVPQNFDWREALLAYIKTTALFPQLLRIVFEAQVFNETLQEQHHQLQLENLSGKHLTGWFMRRWSVSQETWEYALLDRGFRDASDFLGKARPFYLFDKYVGIAPLSLKV